MNGGKAIALKKLMDKGFLVPSFFVCDSSWSQEKIYIQIKSTLPKVKYFAVRSSAENEDSNTQSFAGHFYSGIGVPKEKVYEEFRKVRTSFGEMKGSIIIQEFIPSDTAGVMFSESEDNNTIINSTIGLCTPVVKGEACDEYICEKKGKIISKDIQRKIIEIFTHGKFQRKTTVKESLSPEKVEKLTKLAAKIQNIFDTPQDIEWCFLGEKLYVLQSRPITKQISIAKKSAEYFDSANIAESYSGIVLPLTCSFAKMVYERIYKDLLRKSGISNKKIEKHSTIFENLLGFFYGRMYYNMNNWYLMAAFAPGYKMNKQNFERMITSNVKQNIQTSIKPSLLFRLIYPEILAYKIVTYKHTAHSFKRGVKKGLERLHLLDFSKLKYEECINLFNGINRDFLHKWYVAVENDFFVMTYLGILSKLVNESQLQDILIFQSKATQQVNSLSRLSQEMSKIDSLWEAILSNNVSEFYNQLNLHPKVNSLYNEYLYTFGGRFANELKLESIGTDEDLTKLFVVLKAYKNYKTYKSNKAPIIQLPFARNAFMKIILSQFKKYASQREEFRLLRSNTFGMTRKLFRRIGEILAEKDIIEKEEHVFYLELDEILDISILKSKNTKEIIASRKQKYEEYKKVTPPTYFVATKGELPTVSTTKQGFHKMIYAKGASSGIIKGKVKIFKDFFMPEKIDFDILVTSHTDPGWTALMGLSKGLIIEHGGILSHASIVAREIGIPAVIGASNVVSSLKDGQIVEIDGYKGTIKIL